MRCDCIVVVVSILCSEIFVQLYLESVKKCTLYDSNREVYLHAMAMCKVVIAHTPAH